jgi:cytochrome P450
MLDPMFAPRVVDAMTDELRVQVRTLVSAFAGKGSCDAVAELALPYPTSVFLSVFGFPLSDRDQLIEWVRTMVEKTHRKDAGERQQSDDASWAIYDYMKGFVDQKREQPGDDVLSRVLAMEGDDAWPLEEIVGLCILVSMAGLDTVTAAIGFMLMYLARDPELRRRVVHDPDAASALIEEVLRLEPPAPMFPRLTTRDIEVCGIGVPAGSHVMLCLATANRDADRYQNPDVVDIDQVERGHLTFGGGVHRCLGSHLARRELRLVLEGFHELIPDYEIAPGFAPEVEWPSGTLQLKALPLAFPTRPGGSYAILRCGA